MATVAIGLGCAALLSPGDRLRLPESPKDDGADRAGAPVFPDLGRRINDAAVLTLVRNGRSLTVARDPAGRWRVGEKHGYPARPDMVRYTILALAELKFSELRTSDPELHDRLELGDPQRTLASRVRVLGGSGAVLADLILGKARTYGDTQLPIERYVRRPERDQTWLATGRVGMRLDPLAWIDRTLPTMERAKVREVAITWGNGTKLGWTRAAPEDRFSPIGQATDHGPNSDAMVDAALESFAKLMFDDVAPASVKIGSSPQAFVVRSFDGVEIAAKSGVDQGWLLLRIDAFGAGMDRAKAEEFLSAIHERVDGWVFHVSQQQIMNLWPQIGDGAK